MKIFSFAFLFLLPTLAAAQSPATFGLISSIFYDQVDLYSEHPFHLAQQPACVAQRLRQEENLRPIQRHLRLAKERAEQLQRDYNTTSAKIQAMPAPSRIQCQAISALGKNFTEARAELEAMRANHIKTIGDHLVDALAAANIVAAEAYASCVITNPSQRQYNEALDSMKKWVFSFPQNRMDDMLEVRISELTGHLAVMKKVSHSCI